jgi:threonine/homoserine/homoserine lactone efflux protein
MFLLDIIKMTNSDQQGYWTLLIVLVSFVFFWFFLILLIFINAERCLKRVPILQKSIEVLNGAYLPFFGNVMFLPFVALLIDPFVCDHKA